MRLCVLGKVFLENSGFSRPKPLLLLSYVSLEGPQQRRNLADLFWLDDVGNEQTSLQKKLAKLSVVLAQFKKEGAEVFPDKAGLDPIPSLVSCDALEFLEAVNQHDFEKAAELYQGSFLQDLSQQFGKLDVSPEIQDWVLGKQEYFAAKAQLVLLELAEAKERQNQLPDAKRLAERAYHMANAPEPEPSILNRLTNLLRATGSELETQLDSDVKDNLEELSDISLKVFLALALQDKPNLTIVKNALKLSLSELDEAREELILNGLIDPNTQILAGDLARNWLSERPTERMPLLLTLARNTPAEQAYSLYKRIFERTQGFGGMGDLARARKAYASEAQKYMNSLDYASAAQILAEARTVDELIEAEPEPENYFTEVYALERQGLFKEALDLLNQLKPTEHTPNMVALKSVLLWRTGKSNEAEEEAKLALKSGLDWLWAKATANNTLGYLAFSRDELYDAASFFKKAANLFYTLGEKNRWVGGLNNYATTLDQIAVVAEGKNEDGLENLFTDVETAYQAALIALEQTGTDDFLKAKILINRGIFWEGRKNWGKAESSYLEAQPLLNQDSSMDWQARLFSNLGVVYLNQGKQVEAKRYFAQAVDYAAKAGEYLIQGSALANLAFITNDLEAMEVALELLEQSGNTERYDFYVTDYIDIIKKNLENALIANNLRQAQRLFKKLGELYEKQNYKKGISKIQDALSALAQLNNLKENKAIFLAFVENNNRAPEIPKHSN